MASPPTPQLARKIFSVDSDDSSDDSSLDILPPDKKATHHEHTIPSCPKQSNTASWTMEDVSSDDSDVDELLMRAKATFARKCANSISNTKKKVPSMTRTKKDTPSLSCASTTTSREEARVQTKGDTKEARFRKNRDTEERKQREKLAKVQEKLAKVQDKLQKVQKREQEKLQKAQKREQDKLEREQKKLDEKQTKKRQLGETQQANGKFAHQEIVVLMDPAIYNSDEYALVDTLSEDFLLHCYPSALTCKKAVQWVRKDHLQGGAKSALECLEEKNRDHFEHLHYVLLILDFDDFIPLIQKEDRDDDDFPALATWLNALTARWQYIWDTSKQPRFLLLLHRIPEALDRAWIDHRKQKQKKESPPTEFELQDALQWLLIQFQVECVHCPDIESIQANVHKLTRGLCEAPYANQVTELECIKKIKQNPSSADDPMNRARDAWLRQLQQIPRLSEAMAVNVVREYPTMQSLWQAYQQGDEAHNVALLADILRGTRKEAKLSEALYRFMTSTNPKEMVF